MPLFGKTRAKLRAKQAQKRLKKAGVSVTKAQAAQSGKVRKGVKGAQVTKGGAYAKYDKKSKAAGSFRAAFKKGCAGGASGFSWDGRKYSCAKAGPAKKKASKPRVVRGGQANEPVKKAPQNR